MNRSRLLVALLLPPLAVGYGTHKGLSFLEAKYPPLDPETTSSVTLRTPTRRQSRRCAYVDVYGARIPLKLLLANDSTTVEHTTSTSLQEVWARALLSSPIMRTQASVFGFLGGKGYTPGDLGDSPAGFAPDERTGSPRSLLHGAFTVEQAPGGENGNGGNGLLVSWTMPDDLREFFEKIARWGYPWRLMSGGRHEMSVSEPFFLGGEAWVEVRFSSAHDYEIVEGEKTQKIIPDWTGRLHRGYARLVLDDAVRNLEKKS
ncbi:hypothetical protein ASPZODRAFT_135037 [Penicilliopsis zonata CBS 506.65]|uniref:Uncharacterized protein n=1 Tax=Penicilliopsis zonata CBS 506.65 TaxID=1073090 RepID=A0A1L9SAV3_9EURO|nr:hypothetical protein ASPZODRAFT_135037 [Penicilliopsis zonata CBS 506.65]OJJ44247.1 hypothetical protein ASPZODRAFT_135037 [Penicilliopsis zonata CBS 506.65]